MFSGCMDGATTIQFELVSKSGEQMRLVFTRVVNLLMSASRELEHSQEAAKTSIQRAASLLQAQMRCASAERQEPTPALLAWQMRLVESHIEEHIGRPILVADLSALVNLSEAHFSRAFRFSYGQPPHAYVVRRRVEFAAQLMLASRDPLSEIALKCGFHDQAHLSKHFRRFTGEPPAAWRRLRRRPASLSAQPLLGLQPTPVFEPVPVRSSGGPATAESPHSGDRTQRLHLSDFRAV